MAHSGFFTVSPGWTDWARVFSTQPVTHGEIAFQHVLVEVLVREEIKE